MSICLEIHPAVLFVLALAVTAIGTYIAYQGK